MNSPQAEGELSETFSFSLPFYFFDVTISVISNLK